MKRTLWIIIPVYNEHKLLLPVLEKVESVPVPGDLPREIVLIDDGSTDGTIEVMKKLKEDRPDLHVLFHEVNKGKGAALRTGFDFIKSKPGRPDDILLIQDADFEYDPNEYPQLMAPLLNGKADSVFSTRFLGQTHRVLYYWHTIANRILTLYSNMCTNLNLTDMECCYKLFRRDLAERFDITEPRFGIEPEVTAKIARLGCIVYEVPVSYSGRTYEEGKKIGWRDGFRALWAITKFGILDKLSEAKPERFVRNNETELVENDEA